MATPRPIIRVLVHNLDQAFDARAWHGTPLGRTIRGMTARQALWRPAAKRHNIWEILLHTAYWKYMVRRRLTRTPGEAFPRPGPNWPRLPAPANDRAWARDVKLLRDQHMQLVQTVARFPSARLYRRRGRWSPLEQILGIAAHDLYHCGQIRLLKRLQKGG